MEQTPTDTQVFQNERVRFTIHQRPACVVEFDVEALEPLCRDARKQAIKSIAKEVTLPGFRKGKAPEAMIAKSYEKEIDKESQNALANIAFTDCQKLANIPLLHRDTQVVFKMKSHSQTGALLTLSFETEPKPPQIDPKRMHLKAVKRPAVNEDKVNETIRQIQLFFANWQHVTDRPIQEGDFVLLDVDVIEETPHTPLFSHTRFEVSDKSMAKWMKDLVLGKNGGDVLEGVSIPDESASEEDKENLKPKKVRVKINSVDTATLPALDEDFVKKLGVKSTDELKTNVEQLLNKQADAHVQEAHREQASEFLLKEYAFDLPKSLIEKETHFRVRQLMNDPDFNTYWGGLRDEDRKKTVMTIHEQSEKAVRMFYLCRQIISDAKISVSTNDIPPPATNVLEMFLNPQKLFHHKRNPEVEHAEAFSRLVLEKAEDFVISNASHA